MTEKRVKASAGQFLTFRLKDRPYGVPIASVREINRVSDISPVPQTPSFVAGIMNLRGKVVPVVNLRMKFGFDKTENTNETCIIVIEGVDGQIGMIVDSVSGVVELSEDQIEPAPVMGDMHKLDFVIGMGKVADAVIILVDTVLALSRENLTDLVKFEAQNVA